MERKMEYRAVTIGREYGSGGAEIAAIVAAGLGWKLVDQALLHEISKRAGVPEADAVALDENVDPWLHRIMRPVWGRGADGISMAAPVELFDADAAATLACCAIEEACRAGNCVIVGRGAQCVLRAVPGVLHVFVYASLADRARRVRASVPPGTDVFSLLRSMDDLRLEYVRRHFRENRLDPHLYDLMINSHGTAQPAAALILSAVRGSGEAPAGG
jgi:cytidylate kinase